MTDCTTRNVLVLLRGSTHVLQEGYRLIMKYSDWEKPHPCWGHAAYAACLVRQQSVSGEQTSTALTVSVVLLCWTTALPASFSVTPMCCNTDFQVGHMHFGWCLKGVRQKQKPYVEELRNFTVSPKLSEKLSCSSPGYTWILKIKIFKFK